MSERFSAMLRPAGRAGRIEYLLVVLGVLAWWAVTALPLLDLTAGMWLFMVPFTLGLYVYFCAISRRLHDTGRAIDLLAAGVAIGLPPLAALYLVLAPGDEGPNHFGPPRHGLSINR